LGPREDVTAEMAEESWSNIIFSLVVEDDNAWFRVVIEMVNPQKEEDGRGNVNAFAVLGGPANSWCSSITKRPAFACKISRFSHMF
jgi:hypothetical protein